VYFKVRSETKKISFMRCSLSDCWASKKSITFLWWSISQLRQCYHEQNAAIARWLTPSPMEGVEEYIVKVASQLAKMWQPISCHQGLELANFLIDGKNREEEVHAWKKWHCIAERCEKDANASSSTLLSCSYWHGFMHWHGHKIKVKRGVKLNKNRDDWCTYLNFNTMYNDVY